MGQQPHHARLLTLHKEIMFISGKGEKEGYSLGTDQLTTAISRIHLFLSSVFELS